MAATFEFIKADFLATLFPMKTNLLMAEKHEKEISDYIYQKILNDECASDNFLAQQRVHATKPRGHLRRTVKLDPVAEYFIYDIVYRNRAIFRPMVSDTRQSFGYRFEVGSHVHVHTAYNAYKEQLVLCGDKFKHKLQFDIASYFNTLYHHDICHWFASKSGVSEVDSYGLGKFFRELNAGRSVDFLPQGIYPCKMIGNEFLKVIDLSGQIKSSNVIRFMDDFTLLDDDLEVLRQDFTRIQHILGQFGLNVNPGKTHIDKSFGDVNDALSEIIDGVHEFQGASDVDSFDAEDTTTSLSDEQVARLLTLLKDESLDESDADQILSFLRAHSDSILEYIPILLKRFPNLTKHIHSICASISEKPELAKLLLEHLNKETFLLEYQLFWLACIVEDHLMGHGCYGGVLLRLLELTSDFKIAKAKILEIPEQGFGLKEIRGEFLKTGQSDWLSWASAMGTRTLKSAERNYVLDYFSKGSPTNFLIAECVKKF